MEHFGKTHGLAVSGRVRHLSRHSVHCNTSRYSAGQYENACLVYRIATALVSSRRRADREGAETVIWDLLSAPECRMEMVWELLYLQAVRSMNLARNR
jgi:hypothetical protein